MMGLRDRLRPRLPPPPAPYPPDATPAQATVLRVVRDDSAFTAADGSTIHSAGYVILDPIGEFTQVGDDAWLREAGCRLCRVAGLTHHPEAAQDDRFAPGSVVLLARHPDNPVDPHAVGVWDVSGECHVGFVPSELAPEIAGRIAAGELLGGAIMREYRTEATGGRRLGLVMLIAPAGSVTLRVEARPADDPPGGAG